MDASGWRSGGRTETLPRGLIFSCCVVIGVTFALAWGMSGGTDAPRLVDGPPAALDPPARLLPDASPWNQDVSQLPVHKSSDAYMASIGLAKPLHPDFGAPYQGAPNGIPFRIIHKDQPRVPVKFQYADESDPGPYPIPADAPIEGGPDGKGDRHVILLDMDSRKLYELFAAKPDGKGGWTAGSGAIFDLASGKLRPAGWTSADAAGLPIMPGLIRYDEVATGEITHALRFTARKTQKGYIEPARHFASKSTDPTLPPMGLRVRLKASFDDSKLPPRVRVITTALKKYGMFLADNGSPWFISGVPDVRWDDDEMHKLTRVKGEDFEAVETGGIVTR